MENLEAISNRIYTSFYAIDDLKIKIVERTGMKTLEPLRML